MVFVGMTAFMTRVEQRGAEGQKIHEERHEISEGFYPGERSLHLRDQDSISQGELTL